MGEVNIKKLLVVGGTGFIGYHLIKRAKELGWVVTSVSLSSPREERYVGGIEYLNIDLNDEKKIAPILSRGFDYIVNLGGYIDHSQFGERGAKIIDTHFTAVLGLVRNLPKGMLKRFVQVGSSDEYGNVPSPQHEKLREAPISPYSMAKTASTHFLQMLHRTEKFPSVVLRLFLTYGPFQDEKRLLPHVIGNCLRKKEFPVSEGKQLRDFCYVEDTIDAICLSLTTPGIEGEVFNIASGKPVSIENVIKKVCSMIPEGKPIFGQIPYRIGENMTLYANVEKATGMLMWKPKISLEKGLKMTIDSFRSRHVW